MSDPSILWEQDYSAGRNLVTECSERGTALRMTDVGGGANVGALFYNFECPVERYNMPDTLKAQHTARLARARAVFRHGAGVCSIIGDTLGWHDPMGRRSSAKLVEGKYGSRRTRSAETTSTKTLTTAS